MPPVRVAALLALAIALAPLAVRSAGPPAVGRPAVAAPATPPAAAPRPDLAELRARLPEQAGAFRRTELVQPAVAPGEPEGLLARYRSRRAEATLFLYAPPGVDVPDGTASPALEGELDLDADGLRDRLRRTGAAPAEGAASVVAGGETLLLCRTFRRTEAAIVRSDWLCLGGSAGRGLKLHVLARHAPPAADEMARAVSRLAAALVAATRGAPPG